MREEEKELESDQIRTHDIGTSAQELSQSRCPFNETLLCRKKLSKNDPQLSASGHGQGQTFLLPNQIGNGEKGRALNLNLCTMGDFFPLAQKIWRP